VSDAERNEGCLLFEFRSAVHVEALQFCELFVLHFELVIQSNY